MNNMKKWGRSALCVAAAAGALLLLVRLITDQPVDASGGTGVQALSAAAGNGAAHSDGGGGGQALPMSHSPWFDPELAATSAALASPLSTMSPPHFAVDSRGKLALNGDTHANLEKLLIEENPETMRATLEHITSKLPAQAGADLTVLVGQFQQYSKALSHSISPENAPETEQEALKLLDSLHMLRVSYLGQETTEAMFGADEATTRQLIVLMGADKDPNRTLQQKAERAQDIISAGRQPASPAP